MALSGRCDWSKCRRTVLTHEIRWSTECRQCKTEWVCEKHAAYIDRNRNSNTFSCNHNRSTYVYSIQRIPESAPSQYETHRTTWLNEGGLVNKDLMVAAVTLTEPPEWDVYGSIMAAGQPPPARRQFNVTRWQVGAAVWVIVLTCLALILAGVVV